MNWNAVGAVAELLGAVAVVASLAYLAVQIRQNTRAVRGAMYDSMARTNMDWLGPLVSDPQLAETFERAVDRWDGLGADDQRRINYLFIQLFRFWENVYYQSRQGTLEPRLWESWRHVMLSYFSRPGTRSWWRLRRGAFSEEFRRFLESSPPPKDPILTIEALEERPEDDA